MVQFRPQAREIIAKIVYYGPPLGGKTTNLRTLYKGYPADTRGELVVVPAGGDRTIFFDFLPIDAGTLRSMKLRVQLYTVPGQVHYNATRQIVLRGVDAVVFVADCQRELMRSNRDSWEDLKNNLLLQGLTLADLPHVLQYNKRDLPNVLSIEELDAALNEYNCPFFEAVATIGIGVEETLQNVVKLVARSLRDRFKLGTDNAGLPAELVATLPPMDDSKLTPGRARVMQFPPSSPQIDLTSLAGGMSDGRIPTLPDEEKDALTHKVKVPPLVTPSSPVAPTFDLGPAPSPLGSPAPGDETHDAVSPLAELVPEEPEELESAGQPLDQEELLIAPVASVPGNEELAEPVEEPSSLPLDDPFAASEASASARMGDDVFAMPEPEPPPLPPEGVPEPLLEALPDLPTEGELAEAGGFQESAAGLPDELEAVQGEEPDAAPVEEPGADGGVGEVEVVLPGQTAVAIQRAMPRAMAQMGEVRELEVEVPVPSVWTGGKRMTLQLRLTLVPQPEEPEHGD